MTRIPLEANQILEGLGPVWCHISEYRMTLGYLHLLLTDERFTRLGDLYFSDCFFIAGETAGGPWKCTLVEAGEGREKHVVFSAGVGSLTIKALRQRVAVVGESGE